MQPFTSIHPHVQVSGRVVASLLASSRREKLSLIMRLNGIENVKLAGWYPAQVWSDILTDVSLVRGGALDLVSIGVKIPDTVGMPAETRTLNEALLRWNEVYQSQFRNGDVGYYDVEALALSHVRVVDRTPWPRDLTLGILQGLVRRYIGSDERFEVHQDPTRTHVGLPDDTTFHVTWRIRTGALDPARLPLY